MSHEINFNAPEPAELDELLPAYNVDSLVAEGGMGAVYLATQISLDRQVAIKVLPAEFGDDSFREQFATEAKAMARLNHHNLIGIFDFGEVDDMPYIVMEYVSGDSLYYFAYHRQVEQEEAVRLIIDICRGLGHAHDAGILHRDIKPANILLNDKIEPKIGDFGLARATTEEGQDEIIYGTPGYAAPEVIHNPSEVGKQSDIYAVGVMLHELLTSELPDNEKTPPSHICGCDPRLDPIVRKATHPDPTQRYQTTDALIQALEKIKPTLRKSLIAPQRPPQHLAGTASPGIRPRALPSAAQKAVMANKFSKNTSGASGGSPVLRNLMIIIFLLVALFFAWEAYQKKSVQVADEEAKNKREYTEAIEKNREERRKSEQVQNQGVQSNPSGSESTSQALSRLRSQLLAGERSEFPSGTISVDGNHFLLIEDRLSWSEAAEFCEKHGGQLATLKDEEALNWLSGELPESSPAWLGGAAVGSTWKWIDNSEWLISKPSDSPHSYAALADAGTIKPYLAKSELPFVIQWRDDDSNNGSLTAQLQRLRNTIKDKVPAWPPGTVGFGERRYLLVQRGSTWAQAAAIAEKSGGELAVPSDKEENRQLRDYFHNTLADGTSCWLGGQMIDGNWTWANGEAWVSTDWAQGFPEKDSQKSALSFFAENHGGWANHNPDETISAFLIEWSDDAKVSLSAPTEGSELAKLQTLAKGLVAKEKEKYFAAVKNSADEAIWKSDLWLRGLPVSQRAGYERGLTEMKQDLTKNPFIEGNISRENMPAKLAEIIDHYAGKQLEAKKSLNAELDKLREAYISKLIEYKKTMLEAGHNVEASRLNREISAVGSDADSFSDHLSSQ